MFLKCLQYYQTDLSQGKTRGKHVNMMHLYVYTGRNFYLLSALEDGFILAPQMFS